MTNKEMAQNIYTVRKAKSMYMKMLAVMAFIEKNKEVANLDLIVATGATPVILEALEQGEKIRKEIRKEETITVEVRGYHGLLDDDGVELPDGLGILPLRKRETPAEIDGVLIVLTESGKTAVRCWATMSRWAISPSRW